MEPNPTPRTSSAAVTAGLLGLVAVVAFAAVGLHQGASVGIPIVVTQFALGSADNEVREAMRTAFDAAGLPLLDVGVDRGVFVIVGEVQDESSRGMAMEIALGTAPRGSDISDRLVVQPLDERVRRALREAGIAGLDVSGGVGGAPVVVRGDLRSEVLVAKARSVLAHLAKTIPLDVDLGVDVIEGALPLYCGLPTEI